MVKNTASALGDFVTQSKDIRACVDDGMLVGTLVGLLVDTLVRELVGMLVRTLVRTLDDTLFGSPRD